MLGMWSSLVATGLLAFGSNASPLQHVKRGAPFDYKNQKVRGVNTGGWFVLEPWITPSFFENNAAVDEYTLGQEFAGDKSFEQKLTDHWNTFITAQDFKEMATAGLNHVRIPIGYWSVERFPGDTYLDHSVGAYKKLGEALDWASSAGLKVMIDLHGAPGSQNGFDNSGRFGAVEWLPNDGHYQHTLKVLSKIRDDYASHEAVSSIELLNEPAGFKLPMNEVEQFYKDGWGKLKNDPEVPSEKKEPFVVIHDAFKELDYWNKFTAISTDLVLDTHHYEIFTGELIKQDIDTHIKTACDFGDKMAGNNADKTTVTGEWTGGITDCAKWLNGKNKGSRYEGQFGDVAKVRDGVCGKKSSGAVAELGDEDKSNIQRFTNAQIAAYEKAGGWIFWTWKTEGAPEWDMKALLNEKFKGKSIFPNPVDTYDKNACA